ncbi:SiaB family protein kinase [Roseateles sp.]|uniref:SiaB family protein kinase n=1 Tax=Roseateles sp. TaxID=1971397 RepID=UPI0026005DFB|nr:SiaB family protein kinase [Roseateles sp.]MBV8037117.1 SiaB family protein kinase [Roseateles sp.]
MDSRYGYDQYREFCELARKKNVIFYYVGYFSQNIVTAMAEAVKLRLEQSGTAGPVRRRLFSSFVEMAQNIIHYSADSLTPPEQDQHELRHGSVCIGVDAEGRHFLLCANPIAIDQAEALEVRLATLRAMTMDEIKASYRESLRSEVPDDSKGAGLGFLTVARDASEPLEFEFQGTEDAGTAMFFLKTTI